METKLDFWMGKLSMATFCGMGYLVGVLYIDACLQMATWDNLFMAIPAAIMGAILVVFGCLFIMHLYRELD